MTIRSLILGMLVALALATQGSAQAQTAPGLSQADQTAIVSVIRDQLDAFQDNDAARAFSYASPGIQAQFGDQTTFMRMVETGYPAVYRAQDAVFQEIRMVQGRLDQPVLLTGPDGRRILAHYLMEQQPDGSWRIAGCILEKLPEATA
ncbi:MAG: DUF4864 domain-containing protein [Geminicoccaceae bacterium]